MKLKSQARMELRKAAISQSASVKALAVALSFIAVATAKGQAINVTGNQSQNAATLTGPVTVQGTTGVPGADVLTLTGSASYSGTTSIGTGFYAGSVTLKAGNANAFSQGSGTTVFGVSTLDLGGASQAINSVTVDGGTLRNGSLAGAVTSYGGSITSLGGTASVDANTGTTYLYGANAYAGATTVEGALAAENTNAFSAASATTLNGGMLLLDGYNQTVSSLAGSGVVTSSGGGVAILTNQGVSSTFAGVVQDGTGKIGLTQDSTTNSTLTLSGANIYSGATTVAAGTLKAGAQNAFSAISATSVQTSGALDLGGYSETITTVALSGGSLQNGTLAGAITSTGGTINDLAGTASLTTTGGTTTLTGANGYSGPTSVNGGTMAGGNANVFSATSTTSVATGGTLDLGGSAQTINTVALAGGTLQNGSLTGGVLSNGGTISNLAGAASVSTYSGTTTLTGMNAYAGATSVNGGTLIGGAANVFSTTSATSVASGGVLDLGGYSQAIAAVALAGGTLQNGALTGSVTSTGGAIMSIGGTASVTATSGMTTLSGINIYSGATIVHAGTLLGGSANAFSGNSATTVANGATLDIGGYGQTVGSLSGAGTVTNSGSAAGVLTNQGPSSTFSGVIQDGPTNTTGLTQELTDRRHADAHRHEHLHRRHHCHWRHAPRRQGQRLQRKFGNVDRNRRHARPRWLRADDRQRRLERWQIDERRAYRRGDVDRRCDQRH